MRSVIAAALLAAAPALAQEAAPWQPVERVDTPEGEVTVIRPARPRAAPAPAPPPAARAPAQAPAPAAQPPIVIITPPPALYRPVPQRYGRPAPPPAPPNVTGTPVPSPGTPAPLRRREPLVLDADGNPAPRGDGFMPRGR